MFPTLPQSLGDRLVPNSDDDKLSFPNIHNSHSDQNCHIYNSAQSNKGIHIAHQKLIKDSGRSTKQQHLPAMRLENPAMPHRRTCAHRRRTTGIAYISIIFCYGLFLPREYRNDINFNVLSRLIFGNCNWVTGRKMRWCYLSFTF